MKRQVILCAMLVALAVVGVLNFDTVEVSAAKSPAIYISPAYVDVGGCTEIGSNYTFSICSNYSGTDICGYAFKLTYDPTVLHGVNVTNGDVITGTPEETQWEYSAFNNTKGELGLTGNSFFYLTPPPTTVSGTGILANVTFTVVGCGISNIDFVDDDETQLIGWDGTEEVIRIDRYTPDFGHLVGAVFDHSAAHDVAIIDVSPNQTYVVQGYGVEINVTAENQGETSETFTVTAYYDATAIQAKSYTVLAGANKTKSFIWDTTGVPLDSYVIKAIASTVSGETDTADNTKIDGAVTVGTKTVEISFVWCSHRGFALSSAYTTWGNLNVTATVHNNCSAPIDCTVNFYYYNATVTQQIGTSQNVVNLGPWDNTSLTVVWDISALVDCEDYTVKANVTGPDLQSHECVGGTMYIRLLGDINNDGIVDVVDLTIASLALWATPATPEKWEKYADLNDDLIIDVVDLTIASLNLWATCPP